ncbi:MAG: hypothetical protein O9284_01730 [Steroidobacteraceae bacterium]|jgi:uncharacterized protein YbjT (DUF2867 family)|nr:hypothetical protein [Steroidobacteraceae bacterium]
MSSVLVAGSTGTLGLALQTSGLEWTIVRPSGFFEDLKLILRMAAKGSVTVFGDGQARHTPIAGEVLGRPVRVRHVPAWADDTAPHHGRRTRREFFERERPALG